jgi:cold shock CspA family protein
MEHWLKKVFTPFVHRLSPYASYRGFPELELNGLDENEGIVRWYNPLLGEGYLETYHKGSFTHAWIHWSEIVGAPLLLPGAYVKYATIEAFRVGEKKYKPRARAIKLA